MEAFAQYPLNPFFSISKNSSSSSSSNSSLLDEHTPGDLLRLDSSSRRRRRDYLFDKVVTPSDVGKLNRLVIPKQFAEKFFPLKPSSATRGIILSFEDRTCKQWHFRYSYWNSSQSYVMTKGWSRFVKEKKLTTGDTVTFCRGVDGPGQAHNYIDWHHRQPILPHSIQNSQAGGFTGPNWGRQVSCELQLPPLHSSTAAALNNHGAAWSRLHPSDPFFLQVDQVQIGHSSSQSTGFPVALGSISIAHGTAPEPRRSVRLFGVNLEDSQPERPQGASITQIVHPFR